MHGGAAHGTSTANPRFIVHLKHGVTADLPATAVPVDEATRRRVISAVLDLQDRLAAVRWLASDEGGFVTGQVIHLNGGAFNGR